MKFPYGISDFNKIIRKGLFYCDRTDRIRLIEDYGDSLLFLRPRRFGKSLLLSMLANYYDVALSDSFGEIFGTLSIGKNPTDMHNKYFILKWDFSAVDPSGSVNDIKRALYNHINQSIESFRLYYQDYNLPDIRINSDDALVSIASAASAVRMTDYRIYLLIDEYDNFANAVMMRNKGGRESYEALFKTVKLSAGDSLFDRTFITGVSPVVMSDVTSGYNIAENIYLEPEFNDICGFTEKEIFDALEKIAEKCRFTKEQTSEAFYIMQVHYNGYTFSREKQDGIYNPTLALYFFKNLYRNCKYPYKMLDSNLAADQAKLHYVSEIPRGRELIIELTAKNKGIGIEDLEDRFGISEMLSPETKDFTFMASLLYYLGILTMDGQSEDGELVLKTPNLVTKSLYVNRLLRMFLPEPDKRDEGVFSAKGATCRKGFF